MKTSHQALMLAILMGLAAWILDAAISWHYFPGKTYLEMVWNFDPQRTLFVRSTVVFLFFLFGLFVGHLLERLEQLHTVDQDYIRLLKGIRDIQTCTFTAKTTDEMVEKVVGLIRSTFQFQDVYLVLVEPGTRNILSRHTTQGLEVDLREFRSLEKQLALSESPFDPTQSSWPSRENGEEKAEGVLGIQAPLSFNSVLYGAVLVTWNAGASAQANSEWRNQFLSLSNHVGQSLAHFHNQVETEQSAKRIKRLFDLSPMGVFVTSVSGKPIYYNPALRRILTGSTAQNEDVTTRPVQEWYAEPERRIEFIQELQAKGQVNDFEFRLLRQNGEIRTMIMAARLNRQEDAYDPHIEGFMLDVTHRRSAEDSNRRLQEELQKAQHFRAITVLAGGVAHEFNNILQAMMGSAYLGKLKLQPEQDELAKYLDDIQDSGKRAAKLCDQMLSYAGKRAMMLKMEVADECLHRLLNIVRTEMGPDIALIEALGAPGIKAHLDEPSLSEVVNNLVLNAVESLADRVDGRIDILSEVVGEEQLREEGLHLTRPLTEERYWVLRVRDNGPGIPETDLSHIFEPFFTTKFQGRGLGLSAVAGIVDKFDGSLGVKSEVGQGTEFSLCLPAAEAVVLLDEDGEPEPRTPAPPPAGRIWVVDDEPLIGETVARMLKRAGYEVLAKQNPLEFLEIFTPEEIEKTHCVILDVTMPEMGGADVLKKIRERSAGIPVLIMSGYDESEQGTLLESLHISGFIHKPFSLNELVEKIESVMV